jgi:hypothetical protein
MGKAGVILILVLLLFIFEFLLLTDAFTTEIVTAQDIVNNQKGKIEIIKTISIVQTVLLIIMALIFINTGEEINKIKEKLKQIN